MIEMRKPIGSGTTMPGTDDLLPTRRSLLDRLKDWRDNQSWQEFFDTYWQLIYGVALKAGLWPSEAEEVVQETLLSVAKKMKDFRYDPAIGSFKGWLLQLTGWRITNQFNRRSARHSPGGLPQSDAVLCAEMDEPGSGFLVPPELERLWDAEWEQNLMRAALGRVRRQANPKHFQIFDLCMLQGRPVKEIQEFLDVNAGQVYLAKHRVSKLLRTELKRLRRRFQ